jgi:hypothetical protein
MMVSVAAHFFLSTTCWWRADKSDSPPRWKGLPVQQVFLGAWQGCAGRRGLRQGQRSQQGQAQCGKQLFHRRLLLIF